MGERIKVEGGRYAKWHRRVTAVGPSFLHQRTELLLSPPLLQENNIITSVSCRAGIRGFGEYLRVYRARNIPWFLHKSVKRFDIIIAMDALLTY